MRKPKRLTVPVSNLLINPGNPRFDPVKNQHESMALMLREKGAEIKKLAKDITTGGINPSKNLIVVHSRNKKYLTLEGNRRLVATVLLNSPEKTKDQDLREFFQAMRDTPRNNIPREISCVVFESVDDAHHWIMLEHTGKNHGVGVDPWNTEQKDRFLGTHPRHVLVFDFADENGLGRSGIDSTNLARLLSSPHVCRALGVAFPGWKLHLNKPRAEVKKNIKKMFGEMSKKSFRVTDIYSKPQRERWIDGVLDTGAEHLATAATAAAAISDTPVSANKTRPSASTNRKMLIPKECNIRISVPKIQDIFLELRDVLNLDGPRSAPNSIGVMFRVFLETSLDHYMKKMVKKDPSQMRIKEKINEVTKDMKSRNMSTKDQLKAMRRLASGPNSDIFSVTKLHDYVHSTTVQPTPTDLKIMWNNTQGFFEELWEDMRRQGR